MKSEQQTKIRSEKRDQNERTERISLNEVGSEGLSQKQRKNLEQMASKYYQQASELTFDNLILNQKIQQLTEQKTILQTKLAFYQRETGEQIGQQSNQLLNKINRQQNQMFIPKRNRRLSNNVKRKFVCPVKNCNKLYGSYAALYLHFKNKHPNRSMKLIAHSSDTIKVTGEEEEDSFERQMRLFKEQQDQKDQDFVSKSSRNTNNNNDSPPK